MILSLGYQARLFLITIAIGVFIGFTYDVFRIFRKIIPHSNLFIQIEDAIYWVFVILTMFRFMLHENYGEIRLFSICGAFLGMLFYFITISKLVLKISSTVINGVKYILNLLITIILTPFRLVFMLFRKPVEKTGKFFYGRSKKILHSCKVYARIKRRNMVKSIHVIRKKH